MTLLQLTVSASLLYVARWMWWTEPHRRWTAADDKAYETAVQRHYEAD